MISSNLTETLDRHTRRHENWAEWGAWLDSMTKRIQGNFYKVPAVYGEFLLGEHDMMMVRGYVSWPGQQIFSTANLVLSTFEPGDLVRVHRQPENMNRGPFLKDFQGFIGDHSPIDNHYSMNSLLPFSGVGHVPASCLIPILRPSPDLKRACREYLARMDRCMRELAELNPTLDLLNPYDYLRAIPVFQGPLTRP